MIDKSLGSHFNSFVFLDGVAFCLLDITFVHMPVCCYYMRPIGHVCNGLLGSRSDRLHAHHRRQEPFLRRVAVQDDSADLVMPVRPQHPRTGPYFFGGQSFHPGPADSGPQTADETRGVPGAPVAPHRLGQRHPVHNGDEVDETAARQEAMAPLVQRSQGGTENQKAERHLLSSFVSCYHPISNKQSPGGPV